MSDIHFEIDMELLGCNAKTLFNELYYHIIEIFSTKEGRNGIILCKNFHPNGLRIYKVNKDSVSMIG